MKRKFEESEIESDSESEIGFNLWLSNLSTLEVDQDIKIEFLLRNHEKEIRFFLAKKAVVTGKDLEKRLTAYERKFIQALDNAKSQKIFTPVKEQNVKLYVTIIGNRGKVHFHCSRLFMSPDIDFKNMEDYMKFFFADCPDKPAVLKHAWTFFR